MKKHDFRQLLPKTENAIPGVMKVKFLKDHYIDRTLYKPCQVVELSNDLGEWLVANGFAANINKEGK